MANRRLSMRKIKEILRLKFKLWLSRNNIAKACGISTKAVSNCLSRAENAGMGWPVPEGIGDPELEDRLYSQPVTQFTAKPNPDWNRIYREMKKRSVTLILLWEEYKEEHPDGIGYSRFCEKYSNWTKKLDPVMRLTHKAGETLFVDYAGQTVPIIDRNTGEIKDAEIFVAAMGASNYTYAEATWSQSLPDWVSSHVRAFEFLEGVPEIIVPDNLKSGVKAPCRYEPDINPTYHDMASHYGCAVIPARVKAPKDKAKVETSVLIAERRILARLRNRTFFSLAELNKAIKELLVDLNNRPFQKLPDNRTVWFQNLDKPALNPLPVSRYEYAEWKKARVHIDYHVQVEHHFYSVPYKLIKQEVDVRITQSTVEILHKGRRVASHCRSDLKGRHTTINEHMPKSHQKYAEWSPERLIKWASKSGESVARVIEKVLESRTHVQQGYRSALGILRLEKEYGHDRLEAACKRALDIQSPSYKSIKALLKSGLDRMKLPENIDDELHPIDHSNVRGSQYYKTDKEETDVTTSYH